MPTSTLEKEPFTCVFCNSSLTSEEEVLERTCIPCINKMGAGWKQFFDRTVRPRPK